MSLSLPSLRRFIRSAHRPAVRHAVALPRFAFASLAQPRIRLFSSEANPLNTKGALSGRPDDNVKKLVRIYKPARTASQQGVGGQRWRIRFEDAPNRWENPLMGWTSANSTLTQVEMPVEFDSKEEAVEYCGAQGFDFLVDEQHDKRSRPKSYSDNFRTQKYKLELQTKK